MPQYIQVLTTTGRNDDAERIATMLVDERLAACVQVLGPIGSTYRWKNEIENAQEWLLPIKTRMDLYAEVEKAIRAAIPTRNRNRGRADRDRKCELPGLDRERGAAGEDGVMGIRD